MEIRCSWSKIKQFLESNKLVGDHKREATICNLCFEKVFACCSLSNPSATSRFLHRVFALITTGQWIDDVQIGKSLFYEYLWVASSVGDKILGTGGNCEELLVRTQHALINKVFSEVVLTNYKLPDDNNFSSDNVSSIQNINNLNADISIMFPVEREGNSGASFASRIHSLSNLLYNADYDLNEIEKEFNEPIVLVISKAIHIDKDNFWENEIQ